MEKTNVDAALAIFFIAFAVVMIAGLVVIPAIQEAQAANAISGSKNKGEQGAISSDCKRQGKDKKVVDECTEPPPPECAVEITADKEIYGPEDVVAITIKNTGDVDVKWTDSALGLEIKNVDTGEVFPLDAQPTVVTFAPGASATFQFTYEELVSEIGTGLISATVPSECTGTVEEVTFVLSAAPPSP